MFFFRLCMRFLETDLTSTTEVANDGQFVKDNSNGCLNKASFYISKTTRGVGLNIRRGKLGSYYRRCANMKLMTERQQ